MLHLMHLFIEAWDNRSDKKSGGASHQVGRSSGDDGNIKLQLQLVPASVNTFQGKPILHMDNITHYPLGRV